MSYKTITTIITRAPEVDALLPQALAVARHFEAHLDVICLGLDRSQPALYYAGASAVVFEDNLAQAREEARQLEEQARAALKAEPGPWSVVALTGQILALSGLVAHRTRFSDLVVLPRPYGEGRSQEDEAIVEAALFDGQVPVLIMPDDKPFPEKIRRVIVAWNESDEALRAARAALPFLQEAEEATVTVIDPPQHGPERSDPGGALSEWLTRHGAHVTVAVLARTLPRISDILNRQVQDLGADLLVMGAYSHSRFRESIMGGATRDMLETAQVPVLMSH